MSTLRPEFHTNLVSKMQEDILYQRRYLYYFLSKIEPWGNELEPPVESPISNANDIIIRNNILFMGRVGPTDASIVIPRYDWTSGTVFEQWDYSKDMSGKKFFCVNDEFNVYKCLNNNLGNASTVKPAGTSLEPFRTDDGYLWKFMYSIPLFKRRKFVSTQYIPVQKALTDTFLNKGAIENVVVNSGGSGYVDTPQTRIELSGTTTGSGALATIGSVNRFGSITSINIINAGSGYTLGSRLLITSDLGRGAIIEPINTNGRLTGFNIIDGGFNYKLTDTISIVVGGGVLIPVVSRSTGSILDVIIQDAGVGYTTAPVAIVTQFGTSGAGKFGNSTAILRTIVNSGKIDHVIIDDPGINYPSDSATSIVVQGDGTGASIVPIISNGSIVGATVESTGENYTYARLLVIGSGEGASLSSILAGSDTTSIQSTVEQTAIPGSIYAIEITEPGEGYSYTKVNITGNGQGATAYAKVIDGKVDSIIMNTVGSNYLTAAVSIVSSSGLGATAAAVIQNGSIIGINVTNGGSGYRLPSVEIIGDGNGCSAIPVVSEMGSIERVFVETFGSDYSIANVTFNDPVRPDPSELTNAQAYAIMSPPGGHGLDAPKELNGNTICIFSALRDESKLIATKQEYRQYGLIEDPLDLFTKNKVSNQSDIIVFKVVVGGSIQSLSADDELLCNNKRYRIVSIDNNVLNVMQISHIYQLPSGNFVSASNQSAIYPIISVEDTPTIDKYSGNLLYVTNKAPFTTTETQSIAIRTYLTL